MAALLDVSENRPACGQNVTWHAASNASYTQKKMWDAWLRRCGAYAAHA
jgi:hypothetical protein